jgi:lysyl-tRNA synthetase class 2
MSVVLKADLPSVWQPGASLSVLRERAQLLHQIRRFFAEREVLEVETPVLGRCFGTDPAIQPFETCYPGAENLHGEVLYLQSSPEFYMKRLLTAGSGPIYQVSKAFRNGEAGQRHNPEFSLLEWYRPGFTVQQLMEEVAALMQYLLGTVQPRVVQHTYAALFADCLQLDVFTADSAALQAYAIAQQIPDAAALQLGKDGWLNLLMSVCIEPQLISEQLTFITDYPASQAALAALNQRDPRTAARFELYYQGLELANGFQELTDAEQQATRFATDNALREANGQQALPIDTAFLAALAQGMPVSAGVALGLDRVLMGKLGLSTIDQVQAFSLERI